MKAIFKIGWKHVDLPFLSGVTAGVLGQLVSWFKNGAVDKRLSHRWASWAFCLLEMFESSLPSAYRSDLSLCFGIFAFFRFHDSDVFFSVRLGGL
jgi:hypothetical protein